MLSRIVVLLSFVSLFTDIASEMLYPVLPVYLQSIGYTALFLGVFESVAEAVTGLSKAYMGVRSDVTGRRLPFVRAGYTLSAIAKPLLVLFSGWGWILATRSLERLGKGIRTGARDAMLADASTPETRGRVFGFHRAMDTTGAVLGPLLALFFLSAFPEAYRTLFLLTLIPGAIAVLLLLLLKEGKGGEAARRRASGRAPWRDLPAPMRQFTAKIGLFYLFNSADTFLLLYLKGRGASDSTVIGAYVLYNIVYAAAAYPLGRLADAVGMRRVLVGGLLTFGVVYGGFAIAPSVWWCFVLFAVYGLYAAGTEGVAKAYVSTLVAADHRATALGTYAAVQSVAMVCASLLTGIVWTSFGAPVALGLSGAMAVLAAILLAL